jgi:hypothetical protein
LRVKIFNDRGRQ